MNSVQKTKSGFTLIELLVVIAIIALLLSVILPSLRRAKESAKALSCRSNLRQMAIAFNTYSVENDGRMFAFGYVGDKGYWFRNIAPYLGDVDFKNDGDLQTSGVMKVGICPVTKIQTEDSDGTAPDNRSTWYWGAENIIGSYSVNAWVLPDPAGHGEYWGIPADEAKKRQYGQWAHIRGDVGIIADAYRMDNWPAQVPNIRVPTAAQLTEPSGLDHNLESFMLRYTVDRHSMAVNVAYADGSCEKVKLEDLYMKKWNKNDGPMDVGQIPN